MEGKNIVIELCTKFYFILYRNGAATNFATKQSEDEKADSNGQNCVKEGANDE